MNLYLIPIQFKRFIHFLFILVLPLISVQAQNMTNNWIFNGFSLNFGNGKANVTGNTLSNYISPGYTSISDSLGNLLIYTNSFKVWDENDNLVLNGDSLLVPGTQGLSLQESLIIPKPGNRDVFYIFTVDPYNGNSASGLYYAELDNSLNGGLGKVVKKRTKLVNQTTSKITAVYHKNKKDVWLITHKHNTNSYYTFLVTDSGVIHEPVVSTIGEVHGYSDGKLKASTDGSKVVSTFDSKDFHLFDFNSESGELINTKTFSLPVEYRGCGGAEFSPDGTKLYVMQLGSTGEEALYQFDISSNDEVKIRNSRIRIIAPYSRFKNLQLAPNGKIYITNINGDYLGVIQFPNEPGINCGINENGLYLNGIISYTWSTPNFIQNYLFKTDFQYVNGCEYGPTSFYITNNYRLDSARWLFGEGNLAASSNPVFNFTNSGKYTVKLIAYYPEKTDTITKQITINPVPDFELGDSIKLCFRDELVIDKRFESYRWNTGDTTRWIKTQETGWYNLKAKNSFGCFYSDSVFVDIVDLPEIDLPDSLEFGSIGTALLNPGVFSSYLWNTGDTSASINVKEQGWYSVAVKNEFGCLSAKSIYVYQFKEPINREDGWEVLNPIPSMNAGLDICFVNDEIGFILTGQELLRTTDGGDTWEVMMKIASGRRIVFKNMIGYIIGDNGLIYKSTHLGEGWNRINNGFTDNLTSITLLHQDTIFITSNNKLFKSYDGGKGWLTINTTGIEIEDSYFTSFTTGHVAGKYGKILKTINGGHEWKVTASSNVTPSDFFRICFVNEKTGFASQEHDDIYKTTDGGETWTEIASLDAIYGMYFLDENTGFIAGDDGAIHKTSDGGETWEWAGFDGRIWANDLFSIYFLNEEKGFATGMRGRIIKTLNSGKSWEEYSATYIDIQQLQFSSRKIGYALSGYDFYKTTDAGYNWYKIGRPVEKTKTGRFQFLNDSVGYTIAGGNEETSAYSGSVFKTVDGGIHWVKTNNGHEILIENLYSIFFVNEDIGYVSGGFNSDAAFRTLNGGNTWERIENISFGQIQFLNSKVGYARNVGNAFNRIYKTVDGGDNWNVVFEIEEDIQSFYFTDENNGYFVGDNALMYKTNDGGSNWHKLEIPYEYYKQVKFYNNNFGYILDEEGVLYQTSNGGEHWARVISLYGITSIELTGDEIFITGLFGRILKNKFNPGGYAGVEENFLTKVDDNIIIVPNPIINYFEIKTPVTIDKLEIRDLNGKLHKTTLNKKGIDISGLPGGIYFLRIYSNNRVFNKKIVKK